MKKLLPILIIGVFSIVFYIIFTQVSTGVTKKRVECQNRTTTFERIFVESPVKEAIGEFKKSNYTIKSNIEYSKYMTSNIKGKVSIEDLDKQLLNSISKFNHTQKTTTNSNNVLIDYYLYENDKEDSSKKNDKAKKYAGYLMFDFKYNNKLVYKIQTDYTSIDTNDVGERMDCVIESFISIEGN